MQVRISATSIGGNANLFNIYQNTDSFNTAVATGVTRNDILSGYTVTINDATTIVKLISSGGVCNGRETNISINPSGTITVRNIEDVENASTTSAYKDGEIFIFANFNNGDFASGVIYENEPFQGNIFVDGSYGRARLIVNSSIRGTLFNESSSPDYLSSITSGIYTRQAGENIDITGSFFSLPPPSNPPGGSGCFVAGTMIKLADGTEAAIETLSVGVELESSLINTLEDTNNVHALHMWSSSDLIETRTTSPIYKFHPKEVYHTIIVNGGLLEATRDHIQLARVNGTWRMINMEHLAVGDYLYNYKGDLIEVTSIEINTEPRTIYKLTLSDASHTYFANNILTHNRKEAPPEL
jgi:hypothetical protein